MPGICLAFEGRMAFLVEALLRLIFDAATIVALAEAIQRVSKTHRGGDGAGKIQAWNVEHGQDCEQLECIEVARGGFGETIKAR